MLSQYLSPGLFWHGATAALERLQRALAEKFSSHK